MTITDIKKIFLPKNTLVDRNNSEDARGSAPLPNDAISLYEIIVDIAEYLGFSSGGATNLSTSSNSTTVTVASSTGTDATITAATTSVAGVMTATDKTNLQGLLSLDGVADGATNLGTFSGSIIPDNATIKSALQSLETSVGSIVLPTTGNLTSLTSALSVVNGTNAVIGSGTTVTVVPASISLSSLGGTLPLIKLSTTGASLNDVITFNGTNWVTGTVPTTALSHNDLTGIQGGITNEYYHLKQSIYTALTLSATDRLIGRDSSGVGEIASIALVNSLTFTNSNSIQLVNDAASPGNSKYYGTSSIGTKGFHPLPTYITSVIGTDTADIDITVFNPTTTPIISGVLVPTGVIAGSYGSAVNTNIIDVDANGRITSIIEAPIAIDITQIANFDESVEDLMSAFILGGSGISVVYNDVANTLTINATGAGTVSGTGGIFNVAYWDSPTSITGDNNFTYDGTNLGINTPTLAINSILTTKGISTGALAWGYSHLDSADNVVFSVADNGELNIGDVSGSPININNLGIDRSTGYTLATSSGNVTLSPSNIVYVTSPMGINTSTVGSNKLRVVGSVRMDLGGDLTGDLLYRDSSGNLARLGIGTSGQVLIGGTTPSWAALPTATAVTEGYIESSTATSIDLDANVGEVKDVDGTNIAFTLPSNLSALFVYRNGVLLDRTGTTTTRDYSVNTLTNTITFVIPLTSTERVTIKKIT